MRAKYKTIDGKTCEVGSKVRLYGLQGASELNERQGTCEEWNNESNRWTVLLHNGALERLKPDNLQVLAVCGSEVRLHGLQDAELKDAQGSCEEWDKGNGRWNVRLQNGDVKSLKPTNILVLDDVKPGPDPGPPPKKRQRCENPKISLQQLRVIFDKCDINKDGVINKREFIKACRGDPKLANFFGLPTAIRAEDGSRTQMEGFFQAVDIDNDREIRWAELLAYYRHMVVDL